MLDDTPSTTAVRVAFRRAAHQVLDRPPVFEDPLALALSPVDADALESDPRNHSPFGRGLRAFVAARSRWAEDRLERAVADGARQYVVIGAGLDTFGLRNPFPGLRVFEVDHPATQRLKLERIAAAGLDVPGSLAFAAVDFRHRTLPAGLSEAGFDEASTAFFSWLGVVPYLQRAAALETLGFVASVAAPVEVVFDYAVETTLLAPRVREAVEALAARVAAAGEPFQTFLAPEELDADLRRLGFDEVEEVGAEALNDLYFRGRGDGLALRGGAGRIAAARRTAV